MKTNLNEADRYLLEHWEQSLEFEQGMNDVRTKYDQVFQAVIDELKEKEWWKEGAFRSYASQLYGCIGFGKKVWLSTDHKWEWPSLWLDDLDLEYILVDTETTPCVYVWLGGSKNQGPSPEVFKEKLLKAAAPQIGKLPPRLQKYESGKTILCWPLSGEKAALKQMLLKGETEALIEALVNELDRLAPFIQPIDSVLGVG
jgi:hypothetical protein